MSIQNIVTLGEVNREVCDIFSNKGIYMQPRYLTHRANKFGIKGVAKIENGEEKNRGLWVMRKKTADFIINGAATSQSIPDFWSLLNNN